MIFYQNSNAVCSKVNKVQRQFLTSIRVEYEMSRTLDHIIAIPVPDSLINKNLCAEIHNKSFPADHYMQGWRKV